MSNTDLENKLLSFAHIIFISNSNTDKPFDTFVLKMNNTDKFFTSFKEMYGLNNKTEAYSSYINILSKDNNTPFYITDEYFNKSVIKKNIPLTDYKKPNNNRLRHRFK